MLTFYHTLQTWKTRQSRAEAGEAPLRAELFSVEQQARHAGMLAEFHRVSNRRCSNRLLDCLDRNEMDLRAFNRSTRAVDPGRRITPAAEWLLDNHYLIEEQIQMARQHLPRGYSRELPRLANGTRAGLPRVYDIVVELIAHVDAQIDYGELAAFIAAYQTVNSLKVGELWAVPIMLRLGLIENLQRITTHLIRAREDRDLADTWVDRLRDMAEKTPSELVVVVADMARSNPPISSAFVAEFCQRLSHHSPALHLAHGWLQHRLLEDGLTIERLIDLENQNQAADQVSVSHSIASLRFLGATNWKDFVEGLSLTEETLRADPAGCYEKMDFATRDHYRHVVEGISRHSRLTEGEVARLAIQQAVAAAAQVGIGDRSAHVGYYLIDRGLPVIERMARVRWPWRSGLERLIRHFPMTFYVGKIGILTLLMTLGFTWHVRTLGVPEWSVMMLAIVFLICASQLAVALMNWLTTFLVSPRLLPRLDFSSGIAPESRTMVVVPTMLASSDGIDHLIETLEIHCLANRDDHLHFALLTDFCDADQENLPGDEALVQQARDGVEMLNHKYPSTGESRFFLLHRPRRWNPTDGLWMGYERKRGKLTEFNALLRGGSNDCFSTIIGETTIFPLIRYVITLDTDTQLPRDAARRLAGTMAHPLNHPVFDAIRGVVTDGYGILQPQVGVSLPSARRSWFVKLFASDAGIDPYTRAVSNVYQDLFSEGSFIGKGIYDVDAFRRAMKGRFRENTILSHDLLESCHARSALISDVEFYEDYPSRYHVDVDRRHRWMRGDWQIAQWLLPRIPGDDPRIVTNPLSGLSRWKIFDNLRRSLVPAGMMGLILGGWLLAPQLGALSAWLVIGIIALPILLESGVGLLRKPSALPWIMHLRDLAESSARQLAQAALTIAFLPYEAFFSLDAVCRTLTRLTITRKSLLEWKTSGDCERSHQNGVVGVYVTMWVGPVLALASGLTLGVYEPGLLRAVWPILVAWFASPWIAWWISRPIETATHDLSAYQLAFLKNTARKTLQFF
ncbi:MAG: hypothetical protein H8M99_03310 [Gloeobacteraceae cyanobacterium ES-bin-144]|nr:hypothetical protein [Verrucomicrobiales bacterium]